MGLSLLNIALRQAWRRAHSLWTPDFFPKKIFIGTKSFPKIHLKWSTNSLGQLNIFEIFIKRKEERPSSSWIEIQKRNYKKYAGWKSGPEKAAPSVWTQDRDPALISQKWIFGKGWLQLCVCTIFGSAGTISMFKQVCDLLWSAACSPLILQCSVQMFKCAVSSVQMCIYVCSV